MTSRKSHPRMLALSRSEGVDDLAVLWMVWIVAACVTYSEITGGHHIVYIGSVNFTTIDVMFLASTACLLILAPKRLIKFNIISSIIILLIVITLFSFLRGFMISNFEAVFALRSIGIFPALLALALVLPEESLVYDHIRRAVTTTGLVITGLVALRLMFGVKLFMTDELLLEFDVNDGGRALSSSGALWLAFGAIFAAEKTVAPRHVVQGRLKPAIVLALLCVAMIASGQGTSNAAGLLAILVVLAVTPGPFRDMRMLALGNLAILIFVLISAAGLLSYDALFDLLPAGMENWLLRRSANLEMRHMIWTALMADFDTWPWLSQNFGLPMGVHPTLLLPIWGGYFWEASIHSMYYGYLTITGRVGVTLYVVLLGLLTWRNFKRLATTPVSPLWPGPSVGLGLTVLCTVFGYSYDLRYEQGLMLGLAVVAATKTTAAHRRRVILAPESRGGAGSPQGAATQVRDGRPLGHRP